MYDKIVAKVNNIDTIEFVLKSKYDADKTELEKKNRDTSTLVKKSDYDKWLQWDSNPQPLSS